MKAILTNSGFNTKKLIAIIAILGPGIITANAGNDAGGIATYAQVGSAYGLRMLWGIVLITIGLAIVQEMNARMAVVTGKGLSDLIREKFGVKLTFFAMLVLLVANFGVVLGDFAGVAASMELFGVSKYLSVPVVAFLIGILVMKGSYSKVEKVFLAFTLVFLGYAVSAFMAHPNWSEVAANTFNMNNFQLEPGYVTTFIGLVGTTITPYMLFYLSSAIVDKQLKISDYKIEKLDIYGGVLFSSLIAFFIIVCTAATLHKFGIRIETAKDAAISLKPIAGEYASILFGIGLFGASVLACAIIPLSTSYAICEAFGWESGVDNDIKEAPAFFGIYSVMIFFSSMLILIPKIPLVRVMLLTQQIAGVLVPIILLFMIKIVNDKRIMGKYVNNGFQNLISWLVVVAILFLTVFMVGSSLVKLA